jgi:excisionase family DNA binding protein
MNEKEYPPVLTLDQAAEYLQLSPEILIKELEQGLLPGRKFSGEWRISRTHLEKYLAGVDITRPSSETFATITQVTSDINQQNIELLPEESSQSINHDKDKLSPNQTNKD